MSSKLQSVHFVSVMISCLIIASSVPSSAADTCPDDRHSSRNASWQRLPITAVAEIKGRKIELEVARTHWEKANGLMHRPCLQENRGMLFLYNPPEQVQFWMKNVIIPLDMVFLLKGRIKAIYKNIPPCKTSICPYYAPDTEVDQVLELNAGVAVRLSLKVDDKINIRYLNPN